MPKNIEIKAHLTDLERSIQIASELSSSKGEILYQKDTFFSLPQGRLKLREIKGEKEELIFYDRPDVSGPKLSDFCKVERRVGGLSNDIKNLLSRALGIGGTVVKKRTLFIVEETRIHIDEVEKLGSFLELEVKLKNNQTTEEAEQIAYDLMQKLSVKKENLIDCAYIELLNKDSY